MFNPIIKQLLRENLETLSYDDMDFDFFTRKFIVGRWFESEAEALNYLKSHQNEMGGKTINDFIIKKDEKDSSLKPYRIYPKPLIKDLNRNEASKYIQKYGLLTSIGPYITYPLYAYVEYKHINKLKELGIYYKFKELKDIDLNQILNNFVKKLSKNNQLDSFFTVNSNVITYNLSDYLDRDGVLELKLKTENILNQFNNYIGSDYFIKQTKVTQNDDSIRKSLLNKLDDKNYNPENEFKQTYKTVYFILERGNDEEEFLAEIPMDGLTMPKLTQEINESKTLVKQLLRENLESLIERRKNYPSYIRDFVRFAKNYLGIKGKVLVKLTNNKSKTSTLAHYEIGGCIVVYIKDRAYQDLCRSICHEMVHVKQFEDGRLTNPSEQGKDGTPEENEANSLAGEIMRKWGKLYPQAYEL